MLNLLLRAIGHSGVPFSNSLVARLGGLKAARPKPFSVVWRGIRYHGDFEHLIDRHIYLFGAYAPAELDFLELASKILRVQGIHYLTMLDIGANVGQHSLALQRDVDRIIPFEPSNRVAHRLRRNIETNKIANIEVHEVALGDRDVAGQLGSGLPGNDGSRSLNWTLDQGLNEEVVVRHGGRYLDGIEPTVREIHLIKLDVEGHEKLVFRGLEKRLRSDRPVILFELIGEHGGGFRDEDELHTYLYSRHCLFALKKGSICQLSQFVWGRDEEVVCLPAERVEAFKDLIAAQRH